MATRAFDSVVLLMAENLAKFVGESQAGIDLEEAYHTLDLKPSSEVNRETVERIADFFVSKGGIYTFVGRAAKIRIATQWIEQVTGDYG